MKRSAFSECMWTAVSLLQRPFFLLVPHKSLCAHNHTF